MAKLILGPMVRYVGTTEATVWVETDVACTVDVNGYTANTFCVCSHHYAVVRLTGLEPGGSYPYTVSLDDTPVWPQADSSFPASVIRTIRDDAAHIVFGSCRVSMPHEPPYTNPVDEGGDSVGIDALNTFALRMRDQDPAEWPDLLLLMGDQIYADIVAPATREFIRQRRDPSKPPGYGVADFEEYTHLYHQSWSDPAVRWLLSTVSSAMIFDDHDVCDDWNTSKAWVEEMYRTSWWPGRIRGAFMSYWLYQHIGNLAPQELFDNPLFNSICTADDGEQLLSDFAAEVDTNPHATRWSYHRDIGDTRLVMLDTRASRVLDGERRAMLDAEEWQWVEQHATGGFDHLLIGSSLPYLTAPGIHYLEAFDEALCQGVWGRWMASQGEKLRRFVDLEHWPAFQNSFRDLAGLLQAVASGERGAPPASVLLISGDVHHAYIGRARFHDANSVQSQVYQLVCSPFRNALAARERRVMRLGWGRVVPAILRGLARLAGISHTPIDVELQHPAPWFNNQIAQLRLTGARARLQLEKTVPGESPHKPLLEKVFDEDLTRGSGHHDIA